MAKQVKSALRSTRKITMPDQIDLTRHDSLDVTFTGRRGTEIFNIQFRHESQNSGELAINLMGTGGEVSTAITLFDIDI